LIPINSWRLRRPLIRGKDFHKLPLDKENKFKEGSWEVFSLRKFCLVFLGRRRKT